MKLKAELRPAGTKVNHRTGARYDVFVVCVDGKSLDGPGDGLWPMGTAKARVDSLERCAEFADDLPFLLWLVEVDRLCTRKLGVGLFDLPDMMTRDAFNDGVSPEDFFTDVVMDVAREEGYPS